MTVGHRNERAAEILEGLSEGDQVILFPPEEIAEGVEVRPAA